MIGERIRIRGTVQGVGFRPAVWRIARDLGLRGSVANDGDGVVAEVWGTRDALHRFAARVRDEAPPLARVDRIEREPSAGVAPESFHIAGSSGAEIASTHVAADAAICDQCRAEILDPSSRRHRYAFTNCTHCGPRMSIVEGMPYDRARTTLSAFPMCDDCSREYHDPADRRFHAQPIACPQCGPRLSLRSADGTKLDVTDAIFSAAALIREGAIVAIQGIGGYQLACDATNQETVVRLRMRKHRQAKPFALMARDVYMIGRHAFVRAAEARALQSVAAPIVLLQRAIEHGLADAVAPGVATLGFMLPATPLHVLLMQELDRPIVLTSGNLSDEPHVIDAADAHERLDGIADFFLEHDRPIARRVDDSVVRVIANEPRVIRRARGYAPEPIALPPGFERAPPVLAFGGELKNTFCLLREGEAILSPHIGDLEHARAREDYRHAIADLCEFHRFTPRALACDAHPEYASTVIAQQRVTPDVPLIRVQHHHAHIAACIAENGVAIDAPPVLGVALDGIGFGADGTLWGGEFLLADYAGFKRIGHFRPVAMIGGEQAVREPWRNTYAHLIAAGAPTDLLAVDPNVRDMIDRMLKRGLNAPLASSCGRLFDAVAAAIGIARDQAQYEGQGAVELEAIVDRSVDEAYPFAITDQQVVDPTPMWTALLRDLREGVERSVIAARFHVGLADVVVRMIRRHADRKRAIALSGGVFQNRILLERVLHALTVLDYRVLTHRRVPCNDGGLALGQAAIAAARLLRA